MDNRSRDTDTHMTHTEKKALAGGGLAGLLISALLGGVVGYYIGRNSVDCHNVRVNTTAPATTTTTPA